jgi:pseudaminic acid biosynthesis-associated methylase
MNEQEQVNFWKETYTDEYINRNSNFDLQLGIEGWKTITKKIKEPIGRILECGSNIGRNINFLNHVYPNAKKSIIELAKKPFEIVTSSYTLEHAFNGALVDSDLSNNYYDLVFTNGVLIHVHPDDVLANMQKMFDYSRNYILISEYFNRTPVMLEYRGEQNKLFKSDFGKTFITNFDVELIDYGFLWGHIYDNAGFDDVTFWVFKKNGVK